MLTVPEQGHVNVNINMRYSTDRFVMSIVNIVLSINTSMVCTAAMSM